jgi:hypothetical protein
MKNKIQEFIRKFSLLLDEPNFYSRLYAFLAKERKKGEAANSIKNIIDNEYEDLTRYLERTEIQEAVSVRHHIRACRLAQLLIDDTGVFLDDVLNEAIGLLTEHLYFSGPNYHYEAPRRLYLLKTLLEFRDNPELKKKIGRINKPIRNPHAEHLIRETLRLSKSTPLTNAHARQATLAAACSYLRQNVGSCFATAPAIFIMREQLSSFIEDINQLLTTGELKRTFGGVEYSAPLSASWGVADLNAPFVISVETTRIWEAPGLLSAFESVDIISKEWGFQKRSRFLEKLLRKVFKSFFSGQSVFITTPDHLIRFALMLYIGVSKEDLKEFENVPKALLPHGLLLDTSVLDEGGKRGLCKQFNTNYNQVKNVFKSLTNNALLKSWEFTLASFSETKHEFSNWNLYSSLGINAREPQGIGEIFYVRLKGKVDFYNAEVQEIQSQYENLFHEVKHLEGRIQRPRDEQDARWLRTEYSSKLSQLDTILQQRDSAHNKAQRSVDLYDFVMHAYEGKFPEYFQEVYDADMQEDVKGSVYDDSPAGFRLLYKHGRSNPSTWSLIYTAEEYIDCLSDFFNATEREFLAFPEMEGLQDDFSTLVSEVISLVKSRGFLEASLVRMARAHGVSLPRDPLNNLELVAKKPWVYTSGGTMNTLLSCYYHRETVPTEESAKVKSEEELLSFFIRVVKRLPDSLQNYFKGNGDRHLIMHSPTHAFLLMPGFKKFSEGWLSSHIEKKWIHNHVLLPGIEFYEKQLLENTDLQVLIAILSQKLPKNFQTQFKELFSKFPYRMTPSQFRSYLCKKMEKVFGKNGILQLDVIDSVLFSSLPLTSTKFIQEHVQSIFQKLYDLKPELINGHMLEIISKLSSQMCSHQVISAACLRNICLSIILLATNKSSHPYDFYGLFVEAMRLIGLAPPEPVIVADTNWIKDYFAFVVNPGTLKLEFWRVDYAGTSGVSMNSWKQWFDGSDLSRSWGVYINPKEYGSLNF